MMTRRPGRKLSGEEAALWARVARTVTPLTGKSAHRPGEGTAELAPDALPSADPRVGASGPAVRQDASALPHRPHRPEPRALDRHGLDASWDRRLARGLVAPDFTLDLHGATLDAAHSRLDHGLALALAHGARVVLLITGRSRPSDDRRGRGVIRRKFIDWLAAGPHAGRIAAIRPAHPRHGGAGAVYIVLRKQK